MENKTAYQKRMEDEIEKMNARVKELKAKLKQASADVRIKYQDQIETVEQKREIMRMRLEDLKKASDDAWREISKGLEKAVGELSDAISKASEKMK